MNTGGQTQPMNEHDPVDDGGMEMRNLYSKATKMNKYFSHLYVLMAIVAVFVLLALAVIAVIDVLVTLFRKRRENKRLERGETILYRDSLDKTLLTDPSLMIYKDSKLMDGIFLIGIFFMIFLTACYDNHFHHNAFT